MKKIQMYKAEDGKIFDTEEECLNHEFVLKRETVSNAIETLKEFCNSYESCSICPLSIHDTTGCFDCYLSFESVSDWNSDDALKGNKKGECFYE